MQTHYTCFRTIKQNRKGARNLFRFAKASAQISTAAVTVALQYLPPVAQSDGADLNRRPLRAVQIMKKSSPKQKAPCWVLFVLGVLPENDPQVKTLILGEFLSPFLAVNIIA